MYKLTTPTLKLSLPESVDLSEAVNVYVTLSDKKNNEILTKSGADVSIDDNVISVDYSQEETKTFPDEVQAQVNWIYNDGGLIKRDATTIVKIRVYKNLLNEVKEA